MRRPGTRARYESAAVVASAVLAATVLTSCGGSNPVSAGASANLPSPDAALTGFDPIKNGEAYTFYTLDELATSLPTELRAAAVRHLTDPNPHLRFAAVYALAISVAPGQGTDQLAAMLGSASPDDRLLSAGSLAGIGDKRGLPVLIDALDQSDQLSYRIPPQRAFEFARAWLLHITDQDFGLRSADGGVAAAATKPAWQAWWAASQSTLRFDATKHQFTTAASLSSASRSSLLRMVRSAGAAGRGGTAASIAGSTITITVNMDFWGPFGPDDFEAAYLQGEVSLAQDAWNAALAKLAVAGCYTVQVVFVAHARSPTQDREPGFHYIHASFGYSGSSVSWDPGTKDPTEDTTTAYTQWLGGSWYPDTLEESGWEHEIGHLMGLGDDYMLEDVTLGNGQGHTFTIAVPLPGRGPTKDDPDGTLMAGGKTIDQQLADRIANIARRAGLKFPNCDTWKGPIHIAARAYGGGVSDSGTADGQVILHEDSRGNLTGTITVQRTSGCTAYPPYADQVVLDEIGDDTQGRLTVNSSLVSPSVSSFGTGICGYPDGAIADFGQGPGGEPGGSPVEPFVVTVLTPTTAQGTGTIVDVEDFGNGTPVTTIMFTYTIKLTKQSS